jgi:hypothetical protein
VPPWNSSGDDLVHTPHPDQNAPPDPYSADDLQSNILVHGERGNAQLRLAANTGSPQVFAPRRATEVTRSRNPAETCPLPHQTDELQNRRPGGESPLECFPKSRRRRCPTAGSSASPRLPEAVCHPAEEAQNGACTADSGTPRLSYEGGEGFPGFPAYTVDRPPQRTPRKYCTRFSISRSGGQGQLSL